MPESSAVYREPSMAERGLLEQLAARWADRPSEWVNRVRVRELEDGRMGSLRLAVGAEPQGQQAFGRQAAEYEFADSDGVKVIASLNLDQDGNPFELDVWRVDFSPTRKLRG
jgi:hypothetical protein